MELLTYRDIAVLALAIGAVSLTLTKANIFAWLRGWIERRAHSRTAIVRGPFSWLAELFDCPYCMSHWITLAAMYVLEPVLISTGHHWLDLVVSYFALVALSSLVAGTILRIFGGKE